MSARKKTVFTTDCTSCGHTMTISRAYAIICPACNAEPGAKCQDLRGARNGAKRERVTPHPEREAAIRAMDQLALASA